MTITNRTPICFCGNVSFKWYLAEIKLKTTPEHVHSNMTFTAVAGLGQHPLCMQFVLVLLPASASLNQLFRLPHRIRGIERIWVNLLACKRKLNMQVKS